MKNSDNDSLGKKLRTAEKGLVKEFVKWRLKRKGVPPPDEARLDQGAEQVVEEAHKIIKKTGRRLFEELKEAKTEFLKAYRGEEKK